jgi:hypothetical protein
MRKLLLFLAVGVMGLTLVGAADAHGGRRGGHRGHHGGYHRGYHGGHRAYYRVYGHHFKGGYYYKARYHPRWAHRRWDARYHRYIYFEPELRCYYYYYAPAECYYPVTYCP